MVAPSAAHRETMNCRGHITPGSALTSSHEKKNGGGANFLAGLGGPAKFRRGLAEGTLSS